MQIRNIVLLAAGVLVLLAICVLLFQVKSSPGAEIPAEELARAKAEHQRLEAAARPAPAIAASPAIDPNRRPEVRVSGEDEVGEDDGDDEPALPPAARSIRPRAVAELAARPAITIKRKTSPEAEELRERMDDTNRSYDRGDYEGAYERAVEVLEDNERNVRMLRVAVSSACAMGRESDAVRYQEKLPKRDQRQMAKRCTKWGIDLPVAE